MMKKQSFLAPVATVVLLVLAHGAGAKPSNTVVLGNDIQCSAGNARNGISVGDVTGDAPGGGASDCWGTLDGNDPGPGGKFVIGLMEYEFVAKEDTPGGLSGQGIGLDVTPKGGALDGEWSFDGALFDPDEFLIVLKAANSPGYGVWLFAGPDAASVSGDWHVAWNRNLSHLSIYAKMGDDPGGPGQNVAEGGTLGLLGGSLAMLGVAGARRRRR